MTTGTELVLIGRSSSHYTRVARIFALELGVPHAFRPVLDMMSLDPSNYGENPALKIPILVDADGPLFGTENICRALRARSTTGAGAILRGEIDDRRIANVEEMTLHVMSTGVSIIMTSLSAPDRPPPPKLLPSLENALCFLDGNIDAALDGMPPRTLSFAETGLYCALTHLAFRKVCDTTPYARLARFVATFGNRASAEQTTYRFD